MDWLVLGVYLALLIVAGVILTRRKPTTSEDYFLASRQMPAWAVAISLLATIQSAATFVGVPELAYHGDLRYLIAKIGVILAALVLVFAFLPAFYRLNVGTPYELLESRFGRSARTASAWAYLGGRVLATGARIFIGAVPFSIAVFGDASASHLAIVIVAFMLFGVLFTLVGGVRAVIWTDVLQVAVYLGAAAAILIALWLKIPASTGEVLDALRHPPAGDSKLTILHWGLDFSKPHWGFDPSAEFTLLTAVVGLTLLNLGALGTDQDLVQRSLTCKSARHAAGSILRTTIIMFPAVALFLAVGLLLHIYYTRPDIMGVARTVTPTGDSTRVLISFAMHDMPAGFAGLVMAGLLAAGPAGINASLNSMAASFLRDILRKPDASPRAGRIAVAAWAVVLGAMALACAAWKDATGQGFISLALSVMIFAYAGLLGVFFTALFTRRGTAASAVAALLVGFAITIAMHGPVWRAWTTMTPWTDTHLRPLDINYVWHLPIATLAAFLVCAAPRGRRPARQPDATTTP